MYMHLYCMCQNLVVHAINTIVTDIECNIRIDRLPLGRRTDQWKWNCPNLRLRQYPFLTLVRTTTPGQSVYPDNALHISNSYIENNTWQNPYHMPHHPEVSSRDTNIIQRAFRPEEWYWSRVMRHMKRILPGLIHFIKYLNRRVYRAGVW